ncbi:hypothetical protein BAE46_14095 [Glaciecola punicea]|uniref:DUF917 domain-containing protein n=1 Tax=Glaciecola punicea TaxID=56804 RepID=UPI0008732A88|nr:DUF917 domain-containing protein [Glaciecola punicea]OFA29249.1 hypothetical protein BAE46_14095 [Glaciecola punicea]
MTVIKQINVEDLENIARGAAFLGTGGGGDPLIGMLLAKQAITEFGPVKVMQVDDLDDDAKIFSSAMFGAPSIMLEKGAGGDDIALAVTVLEEKLRCKADAILPMEMGGINSMIPIVAAARLGLPILDADGMGRAFPELHMVTFTIGGIPATPLSMTNEHLETFVVETNSSQKAEQFARVIATENGASACISAYPMNGKQVKEYAVKGTLSLAMGIGCAIESGRRESSPVENLLSYLRTTPYYNQCKVLFDGKVIDIKREVTNGWSIGHCHLEAINGDQPQFEIMFQNEYLVARQNNIVRAIVPDLICTIDRETAEPIPAERLKYGQRIKVIGTSAAPIMRTQAALNIFGPKAFGIEDEFVPIENIK